MKKKKISVLWLFEKDESDAPIKIRIGVVRKGFRGTPKSWKRIFVFIWVSAILYTLIYLFQLIIE